MTDFSSIAAVVILGLIAIVIFKRVVSCLFRAIFTLCLLAAAAVAYYYLTAAA